MNTYFFPLQSSSLAHYMGSAIIKPAKYFDNKPIDIQDRYNEYLLLTSKFGTTETDCCIEIVLTDDEKRDLIDVGNGWFLYDIKPLPITRIRKIYFSEAEKQKVTITNIRMSTAYVPEMLVDLHDFEDNKSASIHIPSDCCGIDQKEKLIIYDRFLGALALMKTAGESYMNYSPNYIMTLAFFNSLIKEQISHNKNQSFKDNYQGLFAKSKGFEKVLPYLNAYIDENVLHMIANDEKQEIKKDKITRIIDLDCINENTWTYIIAILNQYGVGNESRRKKVDGLIESHFSEIKKEKAEGVALCYGYNRGYSAFTKEYGIKETVSYKYKLNSLLDYYTIESVYQYVFNNGTVSSKFPYLNDWCPKLSVMEPKSRTDYVILDEIIIGKKKARAFSEEWWNCFFPKFKEFGRLANELFLFFKEICEEMREDIREEQEERIALYEDELNKKNKQIDDLTKMLNQKTKDLEKLHQQLANRHKSEYNKLSDENSVILEKLKVSELKKLVKAKGIIIPQKAKKEELIKLLITSESSSGDLFNQPND